MVMNYFSIFFGRYASTLQLTKSKMSHGVLPFPRTCNVDLSAAPIQRFNISNISPTYLRPSSVAASEKPRANRVPVAQPSWRSSQTPPTSHSVLIWESPQSAQFCTSLHINQQGLLEFLDFLYISSLGCQPLFIYHYLISNKSPSL